MSRAAFDIGYVGAAKSIFSQILSMLKGSSPSSWGASQFSIMATMTGWDSGERGGRGGHSPTPCTPSSVWILVRTKSNAPSLSLP